VDQASAEVLIARTLSTPGRLKRLLALEKERRDVPAQQLVFVGIHNIAQYRWCSEFSLLKSRERELEFFHAYLSDRLAYSLELGHLDRLPDKDDALLGVGDDICIEDINELLARRKPQIGPAEAEIRAGETPLERGRRLEKAHREPHATIEWNFEWRGYVFVGVPDGMTDK